MTKQLNKYQIKANREKAMLIASGELTRIADKAIAEARAIIAKGSYVIDASAMLKSDSAITRYQADQMDGANIDPKIAAKVALEFAARAILKIARSGDAIAPEARVEWDRIDAVEIELALVEVEEEEAE